MNNYLELLEKVQRKGDYREERTGTGALSLFGEHLSFDLYQGFPLLTTKRVHFVSVVVELLWFLSGSTNTSFLHEHGVTIWDEWADANGDLGPVYGAQWRYWMDYRKGRAPLTEAMPGHSAPISFGTIDQIRLCIDELKTNPYGRRHIVSAWNPADIPHMALPPCHCLFQFFVENCRLSCQLYQRSADIFLGVPFNIASYALLTHLVAQVCNLNVGKLHITFGDVHLYANHLEQAQTQLLRTPSELPTLQLKPNVTEITDFKPSDIALKGYKPLPRIKAPVAV